MGNDESALIVDESGGSAATTAFAGSVSLMNLIKLTVMTISGLAGSGGEKPTMSW
jgi:hypothetical protein